MIKPNEGFVDRVIRTILGVVLLGLATFQFTGIIQIVIVIIGTISLVTGLIGFCGLYKVFGFSTIDKK